MSSDNIDVGPAFIAVPSLLVTQHNLGGLVNLVYVRVGNEVMAGALSKLQTALGATQTALTALTDLQGLHNQIAIGAKSAISNLFDFKARSQTVSVTNTINTTTNIGPSVSNTITTTARVDNFDIFATTTVTSLVTSPATTSYTTQIIKVVNNVDSYISGYNLIASSYYGNPIDPYWAVTVPGQTTATAITVSTSGAMSPEMLTAFNYFASNLAASKATISGLIAKLGPITPPMKDAAGNTLFEADGVTPKEDPTTLLAKLKKVYNNLPNGSFASTKAWVLDGYTTRGSSGIVKAGLLQQEITSAITAGQSLNSSQNASVRNYMFIFEQYYQSASSIMSSLPQTLMGMSRKISQ